jgi:quercetin dioxygenase-like cupin family protein
MSSDNSSVTNSHDAPPIQWARRADIAAFSPAPGISVQPVSGQSLMTCWISMEPGTIVAEHSHPNEQLGVVIEGSVTVVAAGETRTLKAGDAYVVRPDQPHQGVAGPNGVVLVETFVPIREDYRRAGAEAARR